jgi:hypothetical protein
LEYASKALTLDTQQVQAFVTRGAAHLALGNRPEAQRDLEQARALAPERAARVEKLLAEGPGPCLTAVPGEKGRPKDTGACACSAVQSGSVVARSGALVHAPVSHRGRHGPGQPS